LGLAAVLSVAFGSLGCGGTTSRQGHPGRPEPEPTVESLRFSKLVAGHDRYCGLRQSDAALVCVQGATIDVRPGPFSDFALHEDVTSYRELCTLDEAGQVACDLARDVPQVPLHGLALGFFNSCALDAEGKVVCWMPDELGGTPAPDVAGAIDLSVDMDHACVRFDGNGHVRCFGSSFDESVANLHLVQISAAPTRACGTLLDPNFPIGIGCVDESGVTVELTGFFDSLDTNVNGDGCATDGDGVIRCWGALTAPVHSERLQKVSVSAAQICALDLEGAAHCF
jgi:hypothetical protein